MRGRSLAIVVSALTVATSLGATGVRAPAVAASTVQRPAESTSPSATAPTVDLGTSAVNGAVTALAVDPSTGVTYLGGHFTEIGDRSGAVAVVDPPDVGDGERSSPTPEIVGDVRALFADDRPADPGFIVIGPVTAINGVAVPSKPAHRVHRVDGAWVRDPAWVISDPCGSPDRFARLSNWIATSKYFIAGTHAQREVTTGITLVERATGRVLSLGSGACSLDPWLFPTIPVLPALATCGGLANCYAAVSQIAFDPSTQHLLVQYMYAVGPAGSTVAKQGLVGYDLRPASGKRAWVFDLPNGTNEPGAMDLRSFVSSIGALDGAFLLRGRFVFDDVPTRDADVTKVLLLDALDGTVRQRWDSEGEQDVHTGADLGPADACVIDASPAMAPPVQVPDGLVGWPDERRLCRYRMTAGTLDAELLGTFDGLPVGMDVLPPSTHYESPGGTRYLLGSNAAIDLDARQAVTWDPDPSVSTTAPTPPSVIVSGGAVVVGGLFSFVRGRPSPGVAALDASMVPITTFASPLRPPTNTQGVNALVLSQGRLIIGGERLLPGEDRSLVAVDAATGALDPWVPPADVPVVVDDIKVDVTGGFWVSGLSGPGSPGVGLQRYGPLDSGGAVVASPVFGCLDLSWMLDFGPSVPYCVPAWEGRVRVRALLPGPDGSLFVAGAFGSVDGVPRRGLARLGPTGTVTAWDPDLLGAMDIQADESLMEMDPLSMAMISDRLLVGGRFSAVRPIPGGGGVGRTYSPLFVFSASTGALVLPSEPDRQPWFPVQTLGSGFDIAHTDAGVHVALGADGIGVFDATTLAFDEAASAPLLNPPWWTRGRDTGVFVLGGSSLVGLTTASARGVEAATASETPERLLIGGTIPRWRNRVAGNVVRTTITADVTRPTTTVPKAAGHTGASVTGSNLPIRVTWSGADRSGSGVRRYELAMSIAGGPYARVSTTLLRPSASVSVKAGRTVRFRVRAVDFAGNVGAWTYSPTMTPALVQQTSASVRFSSGWRTIASPSYSGGSARARSIKGASASYTFSGRSVALVSTMAPARGKARIYVGGQLVATIDLRAATTRHRMVVWSRSWSTSARRTIRLVVLGTSGRPRVDIDAFVVVR